MGRAAELGMLPEGTPPWLVALAILAGVVTTVGPVVLMRYGKKKAEEPAGAGTTSAPAGTPVDRADAELTLVEKMLANLERDQERDREEAAELRQALVDALARNTALEVRVARLEGDVESRDRTVQRLRQQVEHYQWERQQQRQDPPTWPGPGRRHSRDS